MRIIETTAPIQLEDLKIYFQDKDILYVVDYKESSLKSDKLFIYLSNLDLPCDLKFSSENEVLEVVESYLNFTHILHIPILEKLVTSLLLQYKGITDEKLWPEYFIEKNEDILQEWIRRLDSLTLYNLYTIEADEYKDYVKSYPVDTSSSIVGINFVSLLNQPEFYSFYDKIDDSNLRYYSEYFNTYMFKGNNLYYYWANNNNPMFLLTWGIATGELDTDQYIKDIISDVEELKNVSLSS